MMMNEKLFHPANDLDMMRCERASDFWIALNLPMAFPVHYHKFYHLFPAQSKCLRLRYVLFHLLCFGYPQW
jgi:hypothetical protein